MFTATGTEAIPNNATYLQIGGTHTASTDLVIANAAGQAGTYAMSSGATLTIGVDFEVGHAGNGTFIQTGGTTTVNTLGTSALFVGTLAGSAGTVNLSGAR